jgi:16S rRNA (uracil1498-N3)-methyltransferase
VSGLCPRFFLEQDGLLCAPGHSLVAGAEATLSDVDSHHALRVLRLKAGDACEVVVGAAVHAASVKGTKAPVKVVLTARLEGEAAGAVYRSQVGLVQALTRPALLDEVLQKGTEVGTSFFLLVPAAESARLPEASRANRLERWRRIVIEAAKQSKHVMVPTVVLVGSLQDAMSDLNARGAFSLVLQPAAQVSLRDRLERLAAAQNASGVVPGTVPVALWVGPESGWSQSELQYLNAAGVEAVRLGQGVLRAETAGPVAVAATRLVIGDW